MVPQLYGHAEPALFIYRTNANYVEGSSAHNLDAPSFVQTNGAWAFGGSLGHTRAVGGEQRFLEAEGGLMPLR